MSRGAVAHERWCLPALVISLSVFGPGLKLGCVCFIYMERFSRSQQLIRPSLRYKCHVMIGIMQLQWSVLVELEQRSTSIYCLLWKVNDPSCYPQKPSAPVFQDNIVQITSAIVFRGLLLKCVM